MSTTNTAETLYRVGHWLIEQSRHEDGAHVFRTMLAVAPRDERGWLGLGACHEGLGELQKAARLYSLAPAAALDTPRLSVARARVLKKLGLDDDADDAYAQAAELAGDTDDDDLGSLIAAERGSSCLAP